MRSLAQDTGPFDVEATPRVDTRWGKAALSCWELLGVLVLANLQAGAWTWHGAPTLTAHALQHSMAPILTYLLLSFAAGTYQRRIVGFARGFILGCLLPMGIAFSALASGAWDVDEHLVTHVGYAAAAAVWVAVARMAWLAWLHAHLRAGFCLERGLALGETLTAARSVAARLEQLTEGHTRVAASLPLPGFPGGASLAWLQETVCLAGIDTIVISEPAGGLHAQSAAALQLAQFCRNVLLLPETGPAYRVSAPPPEFPDLRRNRAPLTPGQRTLKRASDITISLVALAALLPALVLIAIAIKADSPGPVLFKQERKGLHNRVFRIWKFRTMHHNMEDRIASKQTAKGDNRVTRVGRVLRKTSFDELPQLVNVLRGDMSIVGPRPHAIGMMVAGQPMDVLVETYDARHAVKPGITGWAQVNGCRGELGTKRALLRRLALDAHYIRFWSIRKDFEIMLRTVAIILGDRHAY